MMKKSPNSKLNKLKRKLREKLPKRSKTKRKLLKLWPLRKSLRDSERKKLPLEQLQEPKREPPKPKECKLRWTSVLLKHLSNRRKLMKPKRNWKKRERRRKRNKDRSVRLNFSLKSKEKRLLLKQLNSLQRRLLPKQRPKLNKQIRMPRLQKLQSKKKNKD